ncbi:MAG TPA: DUF1629 domain-containing protein [Allosphingosinicella sp.]|jgi:hypothetical protein
MTAGPARRPRLPEAEAEKRPPPDRHRKRYYIFSQDFRTPFGDVEFLNRDEVLADGRGQGRLEHKVRAYRTPFATGLPRLAGRPRIRVGAQTGVLQDLYGAKPWFISGRAKALTEAVDPDGLDLAECDTLDGEGEAIPSYWMADATRIVEEFDEMRSSFETLNRGIVLLNDVQMTAGLPDEYHSFYFPRYQSHFIVDALFADRWRSAGLTGAVFTPLQPPTEADLGADKEEPDYLSFKNHPFWDMKRASS